MDVAEALDIVEDEPREADHHQHDERYGHEQHRCFIDVVVDVCEGTALDDADSHVGVVVDETGYFFTLPFVCEHRAYVASIIGGQLHFLQNGGVPVVVYEHRARVRAPCVLYLNFKVTAAPPHNCDPRLLGQWFQRSSD